MSVHDSAIFDPRQSNLNPRLSRPSPATIWDDFPTFVGIVALVLTLLYITLNRP
ncbi:MAG: hypothetical protein U0903_15145 [Planctomycetales bacterium]